MAARSLAEYVRGLLAQGYSPRYIRSELVKQGYPPVQVDAALRSGASSTKWRWIAIIAGVAVAVVLLAVLVFFLLTGEKEGSLSVTLIPSSQDLFLGDDLSFSARVVSTTSVPLDVQVRYQLLDESQVVVDTSAESLTVRSSSTDSASFSSRTLAPGSYAVEVTVTSETQVVSDSFSVTLREHANAPSTTTVPTGVCSSDCNDFDACTLDLCADSQCSHAPITPCCGNGVCEASESCALDCGDRNGAVPSLQDEARAQGSSSSGLRVCSRIVAEGDHDDCVMSLKTDDATSALCNDLRDRDRRDLCYLDFGRIDSSVCQNINNQQYQASCYQYARFNGFVAGLES